MYGKLSVFSGNASPAFARKICDYLDLHLGCADIFEFSNENIFVKINDVVREQDVFVVQPFASPVNKNIMELLIIIDALKRASAGRITAVVPYYAYGRTDKKDQPRVPITARLLADLISVAGADRFLAMDLHAGQIQGFFSIPVDELTAFNMLSEYFKEKQLENVVVVAPDLGIAKRARNFAEKLHVPLAVIEKRRISNDSTSEALNVIGEVEGRRAVLIDDEIDTAGSITAAAALLEKAGATEVYACCSHAVLSGPAIERINNSPLKELVITDSIPLPGYKKLDKIVILTVSDLFGEAIRRIHEGGSIGALFE